MTTAKRGRPRERSAARRYHHGDLAQALLAAAEVVLRRDGVEALTLRAVAREAGVSHTAPQHHFGDLMGLLSEMAAVGYARFREMMSAAAQGAENVAARGTALAHGYLRFARENPALFLLMFRSARLDMHRPALARAASEALAVLASSRGVEADAQQITLAQAAGVTGAWAYVHGLALLTIDGRLKPILQMSPPGTGEDDLLRAAVDGLLARLRPPA